MRWMLTGAVPRVLEMPIAVWEQSELPIAMWAVVCRLPTARLLSPAC